jgi:hypothetical protein
MGSASQSRNAAPDLETTNHGVGVIATKANNCKADEEVGFQINAVWEKPERLRPLMKAAAQDLRNRPPGLQTKPNL